MLDLIYDPPLLLLIGLAVAGVVLLYYGLTARQRGLQIAGIAGLAAAVVLLIVGRVFETGTERVIRETKTLVTAADARDWKTFASLLDPKVGFAMYSGREALTRGAAKTMDAVHVKNVTVSDFDVQPEPGGYVVAFTAYADLDITNQRPPTNWKFFWAKNSDGTGDLLYRIEALGSPVLGNEPVTTRLVPP